MVARHKGDVIGFALGHRKLRDLSTSFYMQEMCVSREYQGRGVGRQIIARLETELQTRGVNSLYLLITRGSAAETFYEKLNFYDNEGVVVMTRHLNSS